MRIEAQLATEDIDRLVDKLLPFDLRLNKGGRLHLDRPATTALVRGAGLQCVCEGTLVWPLLGIHVPVGLRSLKMLVRPEVDLVAGRQALLFKIVVEHVDVALVPTSVDDRITDKVNEELSKKHVDLAWGFARTLSHVFKLPEAIESASALELSVTGGNVTVTEAAVAFTVDLAVDLRRRP